MKITQLRDKDKTTALTTMDMETWIGKTRTETKTQPVSAFREVLRYSLPDSRCYEADKLPKILPAAEFRRTEGGKQMKIYNGIVELTIGPLSGGPEITLVKQLAWEQPQTHCVFTGSSGRSVKIWAKFTRPDNSLPQKREEAEIFHAHAYRLAVKCYQPQIPFSILPKEPSLEQYSRLSYDPELMYRPDSVPFYLSQPKDLRKPCRNAWWKSILYIIGGLAALIFGGQLFVDGATGIARNLGVSESIIGLTLVAGGTSLPELATSIVAALKKNPEIAIGNVIGSNLFNIFFVLGCSASITPLRLSGITNFDLFTLVGSGILLWLFGLFFAKRTITRIEGGIMILCYVAYTVILIYNT